MKREDEIRQKLHELNIKHPPHPDTPDCETCAVIETLEWVLELIPGEEL